MSNIRTEANSQVEVRRALAQIAAKVNPLGVSHSSSIQSLTVSDPPTQAEVQSIVSAHNALVAALKSAGVLK
jgi:hypothetical protein